MTPGDAGSLWCQWLQDLGFSALICLQQMTVGFSRRRERRVKWLWNNTLESGVFKTSFPDPFWTTQACAEAYKAAGERSTEHDAEIPVNAQRCWFWLLRVSQVVNKGRAKPLFSEQQEAMPSTSPTYSSVPVPVPWDQRDPSQTNPSVSTKWCFSERQRFFQGHLFIHIHPGCVYSNTGINFLQGILPPRGGRARRAATQRLTDARSSTTASQKHRASARGTLVSHENPKLHTNVPLNGELKVTLIRAEGLAWKHKTRGLKIGLQFS